jgi:NMT1/THI5 like
MKGLMEGKADATWVFMGWEGVLARAEGVELNAFSLDDYKVCDLHAGQSVGRPLSQRLA